MGDPRKVVIGLNLAGIMSSMANMVVNIAYGKWFLVSCNLLVASIAAGAIPLNLWILRRGREKYLGSAGSIPCWADLRTNPALRHIGLGYLAGRDQEDYHAGGSRSAG